MLSEGLWRRKFAADPDMLGKQVLVDGLEREVVGIMPARFHDLVPAAELWIPLSLDPAHAAPCNFSYKAVARLKAGVSTEAATANLASVLPRLLDEYPSGISRAMLDRKS